MQNEMWVIRFELSSPTEQDYLERMAVKNRYFFNDIDRAFIFPDRTTAQAVLDSMSFPLKDHLIIKKLDTNE